MAPTATASTSLSPADVLLLPHAHPGALACQKDSSLRTLHTHVLACDEVVIKATKKTKEERFYELELSDTVLFPEGGGQPWDTGKVNDAVVDKVYVKNGRCIHRVAPLADGSAPFQKGDAVVATVDWERRFDHMQQHSAQHLFSAIADRYGYDTTTWSLGEERCNVELVAVDQGGEAVDGEMKSKKKKDSKMIPFEILQRIEADVNAAIVQGLAMTPKFAEPGTAEWDKIAAKFSEDEMPKAMRIVCIDGLDANPCCGTHVQNIAHLQSLRLMNIEFARGATRVWFVAGNRVNREFTRMFQREQTLTKILTSGPDEHADRVEKLQAYQKTAFKDIKNLQKELAGYIAADLLSQADASSAPVVQYHRPDADLAFLQTLVGALGNAPQKTVFVLAGGDMKSEGTFLLAGPAEFITQHGKQVLPIIDAKGGGGKNGLMQGKAKGLRNLDALVAKLSDLRLNAQS